MPPNSIKSRAPRILVVDDDPLTQEATLRHLTALGLAADAVFDGEDALLAWELALRKAPYDLILMDCQMARLDGYAATGQIRQREALQNGDAKHTVIIALSAQSGPQNRQKCREAGMDDFLAKPIEPDEFAARLGHWIEQFEAPAAVVDEKWESALIPLFLRDAPARLDELGAALSHHDARELEGAAHRLKSGSGLLGATHLADLCEKVEAEAQKSDFDEAGATVEALRAEFERVRGALETKLTQN